MIIKTNVAEFGSFKDLETFMRLEHLDSIELIEVCYWGIDLGFTRGLYTYAQILEIINTGLSK